MDFPVGGRYQIQLRCCRELLCRCGSSCCSITPATSHRGRPREQRAAPLLPAPTADVLFGPQFRHELGRRSGGGGGGGKYEVEEDDYGEPDLVDAVADAKAAASRSGNSLPEVSYDDDAEPLDDDSYDDTFEEDESPPLPE
mmetsp:Transcript_52560/g.112078  ORF Transcript_52560/g.112078 Transcript_52560/m.112078 type:complete len:141 (-) Transcript_52560:379-801(-)